MSAKAAKHIQAAQLELVERALVQFTEEVDGKVSSDQEILDQGMHVALDDNPLCCYERDGRNYHLFYVWRRTNAIALAFDKRNPLRLHTVRLHAEEWPTALRIFCQQKFQAKDGE